MIVWFIWTELSHFAGSSSPNCPPKKGAFMGYQDTLLKINTAKALELLKIEIQQSGASEAAARNACPILHPSNVFSDVAGQ